MATDTRIPDDLSLLSRLSGVGYFRVDADQKVVAVSPELERITGFTADEVIGHPCLSLMRCPSCLKSCGVFDNGRVEDAQLSIYRKDGTEIEVVRSGICEYDEDGEITGAFEILQEVGAACGGGASPAAIDALMGGLGRLFVAADGSLNVKAYSSDLPAITGLSEEQFGDLSLADLFGEELFGADGAMRQAIAEGRRKEGWRASLPTADGGSIPISVSVGPIGSDSGCGHPDVRMVVMIRRDEDDLGGRPEVPSFHGIVGRSRAMQRIFRLVEQVGESDSTVLVTGESGTGKELVARAIHATSQRAERPFVAVNCAALPAELLESELFGHVRGAFTGAVRDRAGRFEMAEGGTIFLDEIGDLAPSLQAKILRVLQERTYERVGESKVRSVDVRIIAATHIDVERAVAENRFREDLYYRLRVIPIHVPPLRDRREDLPSLVTHILAKVGTRLHRSLRLSPQASRALLAHRWPGNVRELENALEFAVTVCEGQTIHLRDLPDEVVSASDPRDGHPHRSMPASRSVGAANPGGIETALGHQSVAAPMGSVPATASEMDEAARIQTALIESRYSRTRAADALGISRTTLWRKMKEYGL